MPSTLLLAVNTLWALIEPFIPLDYPPLVASSVKNAQYIGFDFKAVLRVGAQNIRISFEAEMCLCLAAENLKIGDGQEKEKGGFRESEKGGLGYKERERERERRRGYKERKEGGDIKGEREHLGQHVGLKGVHCHYTCIVH